MSAVLSFRVHGLPGAQGSKRHVGGGVMVESSKKVKPWRQDVVAAAVQAIEATQDFEPFTGPVRVRAIFVLPRPKSHYRTGKNAHLLKPGAPVYVATTPDTEKLVRSTHDALTTAGVWRDDCLAAVIHSSKVYGDQPGVALDIEPLAVTP